MNREDSSVPLDSEKKPSPEDQQPIEARLRLIDGRRVESAPEESIVARIIIAVLTLIVVVLSVVCAFLWTEVRDAHNRAVIDARVRTSKAQSEVDIARREVSLLQEKRAELEAALQRERERRPAGELDVGANP